MDRVDFRRGAHIWSGMAYHDAGTEVMTLPEYIQGNEGLRFDAYDDSTGKPVLPGQKVIGTLTNGYGHTGKDVYPGQTWTKAHADAVFYRDLAVAILDAEATLGPTVFAGLADARQIAFCDLSFQLGETKLAGFHKMIAAARAGDWRTSSAELLNSAEDKDTPARTARNANLILNGTF